MIWAVAEGLGTDYGSWVKLYQSRHFKDDYPEDNMRFDNVVFTEDIGSDREKSLKHMRERMFSEFTFTAAVYIGGMGGIVDEFELLKLLQPGSLALPVLSTGGAVLELPKYMKTVPSDLQDDLDYVALFHRHLGISVREMRYKNLMEQPRDLIDRLWQGLPEASGEDTN